MFARRRIISLSTIESENGFHKGWIEATKKIIDDIASDAERKVRLEKQECPFCFYRKSRIGGAAMTSVQCGLCDETVRSSNTNVDVLCKMCAKDNGLCKHCGADIDLKSRRKRVLPVPTPTEEEL